MKKTTLVVTILLILINFIYSSFGGLIAYASSEGSGMTLDDAKLLDQGKADVGGQEMDVSASASSTAAGATKFGAIFAGFSAVVSLALSKITADGGFNYTESNYSAEKTGLFTINSLIFDEYSMFNGKAYRLSDSNTGATGVMNTTEVMNKLKAMGAGVANFVSRAGMILCAPFILFSLVRIIMSKKARDLAAWKKVFTRWILCFALMAFYEYILVAIDSVADLILKFLCQIRINLEASGNQAFEPVVETSILKSISKTGGVLSFSYSLEFLIIVVLQIIFLYKYLMRTLVLLAIFIAAPFFVLAHSIKTMLGTESDTLGKLFKTYIVYSFMQPVHAFFYLVFFFSFSEIAINVPVVGILLMYALLRASSIIKALTGFEVGSSILEK